ncbi:hypothetical protein HDV57DRAFT_418745 [Trichoderma longibrachiatum]
MPSTSLFYSLTLASIWKCVWGHETSCKKPGRGALAHPKLACFPVSQIPALPCFREESEWLGRIAECLAVAGLPLWLPRWAARLAEIPIVLWGGEDLRALGGPREWMGAAEPGREETEEEGLMEQGGRDK